MGVKERTRPQSLAAGGRNSKSKRSIPDYSCSPAADLAFCMALLAAFTVLAAVCQHLRFTLGVI